MAQFWVFWPICSAPCVSWTHNPSTTTTLYYHHTTPAHHPPLPFRTAHPKPSHNGLVSGFGPNPLPASCFASTWFHHHHHLVHTTTLPLCTIPHRCFTRRTLNWATTARFQILAETPSLPPVSWMHNPTTTAISYTPLHHPSVPFCTVPLKSSHNGSVSAFLVQTSSPALRLQTQRLTTTTFSSAPSHHLLLTALHPHFQQRAWNWALSPLSDPSPLPPHQHHCTTFLCYSPPPFLMACPKLSPSGSVSSSWPLINFLCLFLSYSLAEPYCQNDAWWWLYHIFSTYSLCMT